jgi:hypothetical protein
MYMKVSTVVAYGKVLYTVYCLGEWVGHKKIWRVNRVKESMVKREGEAKRGFEKWRTGGLLWYKRHTYCREWQFQRYVSLTVNV